MIRNIEHLLVGFVVHFFNFLLLFVCLVVPVWFAGAQAQSLGRILDRSGLDQEDLDIMEQTAATLYASGSASVNDAASWTNEQTESRGTVKITGVDGDCISLSHSVQTKREPATRTVDTRRCLIGDQWVLSN